MAAHYHDQPGLEVAPIRGSAAPEVVSTNFPEVYNPHTESAHHQSPQPLYQPYAKSEYDPIPTASPHEMQPLPAPAPKSRRTLYITAGVVAVIVVLGAVLGGVFGSRAASSSNSSSSSVSSSSSNSTSSPNSTNTTLTSIRPNSPLAATGWRVNGFFNIWLFYQDPNGAVRWSTYSSSGANWSQPYTLTSIQPMSKTPMAASVAVGLDPAEVQFYYLDENSMIKGQVFRDNYTPLTGNTMDILDFSVPVDRTSRLSAFYPHVMSQNANGSMHWYRTVLPAPDIWQNFTIYDAAAGNHTGMAVLPADVQYVDSVGFVYVNDQGILSTYITIPNNTAVNGWAWTPGGTGVKVPIGNSLGAFAYARTGNLINTYVLFQQDSTSGNVFVASLDDSNGWNGPSTYSVLSGADNGTEIACVTMGAWNAAGVNMSPLTDMNRCYYQSGTKIKEVWFDGATWHDLGFLPMD